jgi:hypothetical protein
VFFFWPGVVFVVADDSVPWFFWGRTPRHLWPDPLPSLPGPSACFLAGLWGHFWPGLRLICRVILAPFVCFVEAGLALHRLKL